MTYCVESITNLGEAFRVTASYPIGEGGKAMTGFCNDWVVFHVQKLPTFTQWLGQERKGLDKIPLTIGDKLACNTPPYMRPKKKGKITMTYILTGETFTILDRRLRNPNQDGRFEQWST